MVPYVSNGQCAVLFETNKSAEHDKRRENRSLVGNDGVTARKGRFLGALAFVSNDDENVKSKTRRKASYSAASEKDRM